MQNAANPALSEMLAAFCTSGVQMATNV